MLKGKKASTLFAKENGAEKASPENIVREEGEEREIPYTETDESGGTASKADSENNDTANDRRRQRLVALWHRDASMLKLIVPDFDFDAALKNDAFVRVLTEGGSVFEAYKAAIKPISASGRQEILQNGQSAGRGTGDASVNPARLSSEEFKKYIDNIRNS